MPSSPATVSETTEPTKARVIATLSEAKKYGRDRGRPNFHRKTMRLAPNEDSTASNSGAVVARPAETFTVIGKKQITKAVTMAGSVPIPNQTTRTGTKADFGTLLKPTIRG